MIFTVSVKNYSGATLLLVALASVNGRSELVA